MGSDHLPRSSSLQPRSVISCTSSSLRPFSCGGSKSWAPTRCLSNSLIEPKSWPDMCDRGSSLQHRPVDAAELSERCRCSVCRQPPAPTPACRATSQVTTWRASLTPQGDHVDALRDQVGERVKARRRPIGVRAPQPCRRTRTRRHLPAPVVRIDRPHLIQSLLVGVDTGGEQAASASQNASLRPWNAAANRQRAVRWPIKAWPGRSTGVRDRAPRQATRAVSPRSREHPCRPRRSHPEPLLPVPQPRPMPRMMRVIQSEPGVALLDVPAERLQHQQPHHPVLEPVGVPQNRVDPRHVAALDDLTVSHQGPWVRRSRVRSRGAGGSAGLTASLLYCCRRMYPSASPFPAGGGRWSGSRAARPHARPGRSACSGSRASMQYRAFSRTTFEQVSRSYCSPLSGSSTIAGVPGVLVEAAAVLALG